MKKRNMFLVVGATLICAFLCAFSLTACKQEASLTMETDLSVDLSSDIGLYFIGGASGDFVRYSDSMSVSYFDKNKPTVLFFHGWSAGEDMDVANIDIAFQTTQAALAIGQEDRDYAAELKRSGYNVGAMYWAKHAQNLLTLFEKIWTEYEGGHSIACRFAKEYVDCFADYENEVAFVGHSYGAQSSVATAYLAYKMADLGIADAALPTRISLADPYIGDLAIFDTKVLNGKMDNLGEAIAGRLPAELTADVLAYPREKGVVTDVYAGWPMAYDDYASGDVAKRTAIADKLHANTVWTELKGMQVVYGNGDIHNLTLDWVARSLFVKKTEGAVSYPTAGLETEKMKALIGHRFESEYRGLDLDKESFVKVS